MVTLLKDDDRLKDERKRAQQARARQMGLSGDKATKNSPKNKNK